MTRKDKIQHLLITYLMSYGAIELSLPDGVLLKIGITQEGKDGSFVKQKDYCWVSTQRDDKEVAIDSYNVALNFRDQGNIILIDESGVEEVNVSVV
jgi:hypothetical protein